MVGESARFEGAKITSSVVAEARYTRCVAVANGLREEKIEQRWSRRIRTQAPRTDDSEEVPEHSTARHMDI